MLPHAGMLPSRLGIASPECSRDRDKMSIGFQYESATVSTEWSGNDRHPARNGITAIRQVRATGSRTEAGFAGARSAGREGRRPHPAS